MSEAAVKVLEQAMGLPEDDRRWVADRLHEAGVTDAATFHPDQVPADVQDEIMAEVERRMAAYDADPTPGRPWPEALADIRARFASWKASQ